MTKDISKLQSDLDVKQKELAAKKTRIAELQKIIADAQAEVRELEQPRETEESIATLEEQIFQQRLQLNNLIVAQPLIDLFKAAPGIANISLGSETAPAFRSGQRTLINFELEGEYDDHSKYGNIVLFPSGTLRISIHGTDQEALQKLLGIIAHMNIVLGKEATKNEMGADWNHIDVNNIGQ